MSIENKIHLKMRGTTMHLLPQMWVNVISVNIKTTLEGHLATIDSVERNLVKGPHITMRLLTYVHHITQTLPAIVDKETLACYQHDAKIVMFPNANIRPWSCSLNQ